MLDGFKTIIFSKWLYGIVRILLALLFLYGGGVKLLDPQAFAGVISAYGIVPETLLFATAVGLPLLEVVAGLALLVDLRGSLAVIAGLLVLFLGVLGYGIFLGLNSDCGCFGADDLPGGGSIKQAFYRDLVLLGIVVPFLYLSRWFRAREAGKGLWH